MEAGEEAELSVSFPRLLALVGLLPPRLQVLAFCCFSLLVFTEHRTQKRGPWSADSATVGICIASTDGKVLISAPVIAVFREDISVAFFTST